MGKSHLTLLRIISAKGVRVVILLGKCVEGHAIRGALRVGNGRFIHGVFALAIRGSPNGRDVSPRSLDLLCRLLRHVRLAIRLVGPQAVSNAASLGLILGAIRCNIGHRWIAIIWARCKVIRLVRVVCLVFASTFASSTCDLLVNVSRGTAHVLRWKDGHLNELRFVVRKAFRLACCLSRQLMKARSGRVTLLRASVIVRLTLRSRLVSIRVLCHLSIAGRASIARTASVVRAANAMRNVRGHEGNQGYVDAQRHSLARGVGLGNACVTWDRASL